MPLVCYFIAIVGFNQLPYTHIDKELRALGTMPFESQPGTGPGVCRLCKYSSVTDVLSLVVALFGRKFNLLLLHAIVVFC